MTPSSDRWPPLLTHLFLKRGWAASLLLLAALGLSVAGHAQRGAALAFEGHGVPATATVIDKRVETISFPGGRRGNDRIDHIVTYAFGAAGMGGPVTLSQAAKTLGAADFAEVEIGDTVRLSYLPEAPSTVEVEIGATATTAGVLGWLSFSAAAVAIAILAFAWRPARRAWRLDKAGLRARARVVGIRAGETNVRFRVRFIEAAGAERCVDPPSVSAKRWHGIRVGSTIDLLHDPDDPSNLRLD